MNWLMFDPTPVELRWVDLIVLPFIAAVFIAGWLFGRRAEVQRRVDAVLRRETRPRHPSAVSDIRSAICSLPRASEVLSGQMSAENARAAVREVTRQLDAIERRYGLSKAETLADAAASLRPGTRLSVGPRGMCGLPVPGPLGGTLPCVKPLGHDDECR